MREFMRIHVMSGMGFKPRSKMMGDSHEFGAVGPIFWEKPRTFVALLPLME